ncbi:hypothetical protein EWB00_002211 [Schistosoma japonicum]|uniref:Uncharacterized protein n=1 Tax=Schistosoma japonicum TaxID=6182 RepID=A0A4Z2DCX7_SCHJA|nr:hypothetical protein EWB00_002211 [Schistosoma japonicum]
MQHAYANGHHRYKTMINISHVNEYSIIVGTTMQLRKHYSLELQILKDISMYSNESMKCYCGNQCLKLVLTRYQERYGYRL